MGIPCPSCSSPIPNIASAIICDQCGMPLGAIGEGTVTVRELSANGEVLKEMAVATFKAEVKAEPERDGVNVVRTAGIGDTLFATPVAAELRRQGKYVVFRCPHERIPLVRHVMDEWRPVMGWEPREGDVDLREVADDGKPNDHLNRVDAYCLHAGIAPQDRRFRVMPTAGHILQAQALRDALVKPGGILYAVCPQSAVQERCMTSTGSILTALNEVGVAMLVTPEKHPMDSPGIYRRTRVDDLIKCLLAADAVVAADSGPAYVAAALSKPVVILFHDVNPLLRLKYQAGWYAIRQGTDSSGEKVQTCLDQLMAYPTRCCLEENGTPFWFSEPPTWYNDATTINGSTGLKE